MRLALCPVRRFRCLKTSKGKRGPKVFTRRTIYVRTAKQSSHITSQRKTIFLRSCGPKSVKKQSSALSCVQRDIGRSTATRFEKVMVKTRSENFQKNLKFQTFFEIFGVVKMAACKPIRSTLNMLWPKEDHQNKIEAHMGIAKHRCGNASASVGNLKDDASKCKGAVVKK